MKNLRFLKRTKGWHMDRCKIRIFCYFPFLWNAMTIHICPWDNMFENMMLPLASSFTHISYSWRQILKTIFQPSNNNNNNKCDPSPDSLAPDRTDPDPSRPPSSSDSASLLPPSSSTPPSPHSPSSPTLLTEPQKRHSRASSASSTLTAGTLDSDKCPSSCCPLDLGIVS